METKSLRYTYAFLFRNSLGNDMLLMNEADTDLEAKEKANKSIITSSIISDWKMLLMNKVENTVNMKSISLGDLETPIAKIEPVKETPIESFICGLLLVQDRFTKTVLERRTITNIIRRIKKQYVKDDKAGQDTK